MFTLRESSFRDPNSFNLVKTIETGSRVIYRKVDDSDESEYNLYEPPTMTLDEFKDELNTVGDLIRFETYIDSGSLFEVTRGSVVRNGIEHFFHVMYPPNHLYTGYVTGTISSIMYTKEVNEDDGI